jgi:hypothetical protein
VPSNHCTIIRQVGDHVTNGVIRTQHLHQVLAGVLHLCRFPHALQPVASHIEGVVRFMTECERQGNEETRRMQAVSVLCVENTPPKVVNESQLSLIRDVMLPLAALLSNHIPGSWIANLRANLELHEAQLAGTRPPVDFETSDTDRWMDSTHPAIVAIRKIVRLAESLDRRASKAAIMNATPQRKMTQSLEVASAFSRFDHYYSFLRMFATFWQEKRPFEDFAGNLVFLAVQLDLTYIGQWAFAAKAEHSVETCREVGARIVEFEVAPCTSEVIASPSKRSKDSTDPFIVQLLAMYCSMRSAVGDSHCVRRASWRASPTNKLYQPQPPNESRLKE